MEADESASAQDHWAEWILQRRYGGDANRRRAGLSRLAIIRERVLDRSGIESGSTLLDVGTGDGLIGFGALDRVGSSGEVIFSDVSGDLLNECRSLAAELGGTDRCRFIVAGAEELTSVADGSVDAVTTRAVLIYLRNKPQAFAEFFRVLRPGGRISLYEPINRLMFPEPPDEFFWGYKVGPVTDLAAKFKAVEEGSDCGSVSTLMDFDERDLFAFASGVGFREIYLELHREATSVWHPMAWVSFLASSPNPLAPTNGELIERSLTKAEQRRLEKHLRPVVESGERTQRLAEAHLWARKQS
jgi:ubiquinone/menaquinone biosynthesis C-methylase UbiE